MPEAEQSTLAELNRAAQGRGGAVGLAVPQSSAVHKITILHFKQFIA